MFNSKSSMVSRNKNVNAIYNSVTLESKIIANEKIIYWYGSECKLKDYGKYLGYQIKDLTENCNNLLFVSNALVCVFAEVFNDKMISVLNLINNYKISCIWIHNFIVPTKWIWNFDIVIVEDLSIAKVWSEICKLV